jgi:hypothetical protein
MVSSSNPRRRAVTGQTADFNILIVGQDGRLAYEALLFALSLARNAPAFCGRLFVAEPQPGPLWPGDPRIQNAALRDLITATGAQIVPFGNRHFGASYPHGNKIEALRALPEGEPFVFFDSDTLILSDLARVPFDFSRPSASLRREGTWPVIELYGPGYHDTWGALYAQFGMDVNDALDPDQPQEYWQRYPYYNAGMFYYECPRKFGDLFESMAVSIRDTPPPELVCQPLDPWLDQVALPLVIHKLGGGPNALEQGWIDGQTSCHYRTLPLLYARESDAVVALVEELSAPQEVKKVLKDYEPAKRFLYQGRGHKARALFDRENLPASEQPIRQKLKKRGFWMR